MSNKERKNIKKIKILVNKNKHLISRIIVSEEFMLQLSNYADLVDIETKILKMSSNYSFNDISHNTEDYLEQTYLFKIPCILSAHIIHGAVLEMINGEFFVLKNV